MDESCHLEENKNEKKFPWMVTILKSNGIFKMWMKKLKMDEK